MITVFIFETYFPFLIFVSIFSLSHTKKIFLDSHPLPSHFLPLNSRFSIFNQFIFKFSKFFIRVSVYQIKYIFFLLCYVTILSSSTIFNSVIRKGSSWSLSFGSWIYNYLCNQYLSPLTLRVRI